MFNIHSENVQQVNFLNNQQEKGCPTTTNGKEDNGDPRIKASVKLRRKKVSLRENW